MKGKTISPMMKTMCSPHSFPRSNILSILPCESTITLDTPTSEERPIQEQQEDKGFQGLQSDPPARWKISMFSFH